MMNPNRKTLRVRYVTGDPLETMSMTDYTPCCAWQAILRDDVVWAVFVLMLFDVTRITCEDDQRYDLSSVDLAQGFTAPGQLYYAMASYTY